VVKQYDPKLMKLLVDIIKSEVDSIVDKLMERFEKEIIPYEDEDDPAKPSLCKEEFRQFLKEDIENNIKIKGFGIEIGVGNEEKLGFSDDLDEETTDCVKIIGTIIQGISGEYVLVTSSMTGEPEGRFGRAFIMPAEQYRFEAISKGWDPEKPIWKFSNFAGVSDFFSGLNLEDLASNIAKKFGEALKNV